MRQFRSYIVSATIQSICLPLRCSTSNCETRSDNFDFYYISYYNDIPYVLPLFGHVECSSSNRTCIKDEFTLQNPRVNLTLPSPDLHLYQGLHHSSVNICMLKNYQQNTSPLTVYGFMSGLRVKKKKSANTYKDV